MQRLNIENATVFIGTIGNYWKLLAYSIDGTPMDLAHFAINRKTLLSARDHMKELDFQLGMIYVDHKLL